MPASLIANSQIDAESYFDTVLAGQYRDNNTDHVHTDGFGGAIPEGGLAASSVDQTSLKTTTSSGSVGISSGGSNTYALVGGTYGFYTVGGSVSTNGVMFGSGNTAAGTLGFFAQYAAKSAYIDERYIQASPPYNLGNGDIALFITLVIDNATGELIGHQIAPDPVWANNGPTCTQPDSFKDGKKYQKQTVLPDGTSMYKDSPAFNDVISAKLAVESDREAWLDALRNPQTVDVEVTQAIKNADMGIIPHPFGANDMTGKTIIMIDPVGQITDDLALIHSMGGDVTDIVRNYLIIDNAAISGAIAPPGLMPVNARWK